MFGAIGQVLGNMFGTEKAATTLIDKISNGMDKLHYGEQEKAEDRMAMTRRGQDVMLGWMETTKGQNLARRLIALIITLVWISQYVVMVALSTTAVWVSDPDKFIKSATVIGGYAEQMNGAMMLILAFYFAAPHMEGIVKGALSKFSGSSQ